MDTRKKACPNEKCDLYKKKKFPNTTNYCPNCGEKLVFVCKAINCYKPIEDIGPKHSVCEECEAKRKDTKDSIIKGGKQVAAGAGAIVVAAFSKEGMQVVKKAATKAAKVVFKQ